MLDLSPTKLLIVFVVAVVLLGPKRLPRVARELGAGWRKLREMHHRVDSELRQSMPDLPTSQEIVRFARSPITMLNRLASLDEDGGAQAGSFEGEGIEDGPSSDAEFEDEPFSDPAFTQTDLGDVDPGDVDPGEDAGGAGLHGGGPADAGLDGTGNGARPRRTTTGRAPRLVGFAPVPPGHATDDPHLN